MNRQQYVFINGACSDQLTVKSGVPQGSTLGPLLFSLYINDIEKSILNTSSKVVLYADDTALFCAAKTPQELGERLQVHFDLIVTWLKDNNMFLNSEKTKVMFFGSKRKTKGIDVKIHQGSGTLEVVDKWKYLGLILDSELNWSCHINNIIKKVSCLIGCVRRIKKYVTNRNLVDLYYALLLPHFDYCCTLWGNSTKNNILRLQRMQNKYARIVLDVDNYTPTSYLLNTLKWQSISQRIKYQRCLMVHKIIHRSVPSYLNRLIQKRPVFYSTRYAINSPLFVPTPRTEYMKNLSPTLAAFNSIISHTHYNQTQTFSILNVTVQYLAVLGQ